MSLILAALAILLGGVMKGATGAGAPVIAAPALTMLFDVQTAVAILVVPNLLSNLWQAWQYRGQAMPRPFLLRFAGGGMLGVVVGTLFLAALPQDTLSLMVACAVIAYIALRLARPNWSLARDWAARICPAAGLIGGFLQGATGISAPASITFLNAMRLPRDTFIGTISIFFVSMTAMQIPALWSVGLMRLEMLAYGFGALGLIFLAMPLGNWLGKRASATLFDLVLLVLLGAIAMKILFEAVF